MHLYFSTVVRSAPQRAGGELVHLDWTAKAVLGAVPVFPDNPDVVDPNPRGGARGGRGVEVVGDRVVVASYHTLKVFDRALVHQRDITHGLMAGLHELCQDGKDRVWVASTAVDAALLVDLDRGEVIDQRWPREAEGVRRPLDLTPLDIDKSSDNRQEMLSRPERTDTSHIHLNAVATWKGEVYALCSGFGVIVNLDRSEIVIQHKRLRLGHNLHILDDGTAFTSGTVSRSVELWDLDRRAPVRSIDLTRFGWVRRLTPTKRALSRLRAKAARLGVGSAPVSHPLFIRGQHVVDHRMFVGLSPASILYLDWEKGELIDGFRYADRQEVAVHGISVAT